MAHRFLAAGQPVISVDTKRANGWSPVRVAVPTDKRGMPVPYGTSVMDRWDQEISAFAVAAIRRWWRSMGRYAYVDATVLYITANADETTGLRSPPWMRELRNLADETGLGIHVSHFPSGYGKWIAIRHRLVCHAASNESGFPPTRYETSVDCIEPARREAAEVGAIRRSCAWSDQTIFSKPLQQGNDASKLTGDTPVGNWMWRGAVPREWRPTYVDQGAPKEVVLHIHDPIGEGQIYRATDTYPAGGYDGKTETTVLCTGYRLRVY